MHFTYSRFMPLFTNLVSSFHHVDFHHEFVLNNSGGAVDRNLSGVIFNHWSYMTLFHGLF